ncbi:hypothetical protein [Tsuneonella troitsensis]|uniref:hypothetical protein n=1 Tax=Tsuneonella troitsensis TaxID=292222 RepID=UPI00070C7DD8|nr:hypothetical protein [Tsuneonella troitsensis]
MPDWAASMAVMIGALAIQAAHTWWTDQVLPKRLTKLPFWRQSWPRPIELTSRRESLWFFVWLFAGLVAVTAWVVTYPGRPLLPAAIIGATVFTTVHTVWMVRLRLWARGETRRRAARAKIKSG